MTLSQKEISVPAETGGRESLQNWFPGAQTFWIDEEVTFTADASQALTVKIPAGGVVLAGTLQCTTTGVIDTDDHIAVGVSGDLDRFGEFTFTSYDAVDDQTDLFPTGSAHFAAETTVSVYSSNGSATTTGTITSGAWRVRLFGFVIRPFAATT